MSNAILHGWDTVTSEWIKLKAESTGEIKLKTPLEVEQDTPADLKVEINQPATPEEFKIYPVKPDGKSQVAAYGYVNNGNLTIHTVTAGKTFYLTSARLSVSNETGAFNSGELWVRTDGAVLYTKLFSLRLYDHFSLTSNLTFPIPLEFPAGYYFVLNSTAANLRSDGAIYGYEA